MSFLVVFSKNESCESVITQQYDKPIRLVGEWEVALTHLWIDSDKNPYFVYCDVVEYSKVNGERMQFLDMVNSSKIKIGSPNYVRLAKKRFSSINIDIRKNVDDTENFTSDKGVHCVLHFRKV